MSLKTWWKGLPGGGKWMVGLLGAGVATFGTVIATSGPPKNKVVQPSMSGGTEAIVPGQNQKGLPPTGQSPETYFGADATPEEKIKMLQMNNEGLRRDVLAQQQAQQAMYDDIMKRMEEMHKEQAQQGAARAVQQQNLQARAPIPQMERNSRLSERYTGEYSAKISHFKGNRGNFWALDEGRINDLKAKGQEVAKPIMLSGVSQDDDDYLRTEGVSGAGISVNGYEYRIPTGTRLIAVTDVPMSSDHPGIFTAKIVRPDIIKGALLLCNVGGQQNDRIPISINKMVFKGKEYSVSGQVEMGFPGVVGKVNRHILGRSVPLLVNAGITGGFMVWSAQNRGSGDRIDTRDAVTAEAVGQAIPQIQSEVRSFGPQNIHTVEVAAGTQFNILLTSELAVKY